MSGCIKVNIIDSISFALAFISSHACVVKTNFCVDVCGGYTNLYEKAW